MKRITFIFVLFIFTLLYFSTQGFSFQIPPMPMGRIHDPVGVFKPIEKEHLAKLLKELEEKYSVQGVIAVFESLEGENLETLSQKIFDTWKPGEKGENKGFLFLFFLKEKKLRVQTGYGLESIFPDSAIKRITSEQIVPEFKKEHYYFGALALVINIKVGVEQSLSPDPFKPLDISEQPSRKTSWGEWFLLGVAIGFPLLLILFVYLRRHEIQWGDSSSSGSSYYSSSTSYSSSADSYSSSSSSGGSSDSSNSYSSGGGSSGGGGASDSW